MNAQTPISPLDDRIAEALTVETSSADLAELIREARSASERAGNRYSAARMEALDPTTPRAKVAAARQVMVDAEFDAERLKAALLGLERQHGQALEREARQRARAEYDAARAERDALAEDLREQYPALVEKLAGLLTRIVANDKRLETVNHNTAWSRLDSAEVVARGGREAIAKATPHGISSEGYIPRLTNSRLINFSPRHEPAWERTKRW